MIFKKKWSNPRTDSLFTRPQMLANHLSCWCISPCWTSRFAQEEGNICSMATLMQFPSCNLLLMEPVICSFCCRDACVTKRPLNHSESSRPKNLRGFVAQITRAAPIRALQHNCLFSKQKIPCLAKRFWFRPSALWAGNPIEIKRELVNYMAKKDWIITNILLVLKTRYTSSLQPFIAEKAIREWFWFGYLSTVTICVHVTRWFPLSDTADDSLFLVSWPPRLCFGSRRLH